MTTTHRAFARVAIAATAVLAVGACSGSSSSTETGPALTRSQLAIKANAICTKANAANARVTPPGDIYDALQEQDYFNLVLPVALAETIQLKKLKPDDDAASDWNAFMSQHNAGQALLQTTTDKVNAHDATAIPDLQKQGAAVSAKITAAAKKVGATECAPT